MNTWDEDVRECHSCYGTNFQVDEDGGMVCGDCGAVAVGVREEEIEVDFTENKSGPVRRESQASQAANRRAAILFKEQEANEKLLQEEKATDPELLFCETVTIITTELARSMVDKRLLPPEVYYPLEQVLTHWVLQRHGEVKKRSYHRSHILSFIALAALYIRSSLLPRDFVILCINGSIPYFTVAEFIPSEFHVKSILKTVVPRVPPRTQDIMKGMVLYGNSEYSWIGLETFFLRRKDWIYSAAPLGNPGDTLKRLVTHLKLPDSFIRRVENFQRFKRQAKNALEDCGAPLPPMKWREKVPPLSSGAFSWYVSENYDCCEWPTNHTLLIDVINTIRLCYGWYPRNLPSETFKSEQHKLKTEKIDSELREEWNAACKHMRDWVETGGGVDATLSTWRTLSNQAIQSLQGEALEEFCEFAEITQDTTRNTSFAMKKFINEFKSLANQLANEPREAHPTQQAGSERNTTCFGMVGHVGAKRTFGEFRDDIDFQIGNQVQTVDQRLGCERRRLNPPVYKGCVGDKRGITRVWEEGVEIGLAWTMIHNFFLAAPASVGPCAEEENSYTEKFMVECADRTMAMVVDYINIELKRSTFRLDVVPAESRRKRRRIE